MRYERVPVPDELLQLRCEEIKLSELETYEDLEVAAVFSWICNQEHNKDKERIRELQK